MKKIIWRLRFALKFKRIFSSPKGVFVGNHFKLGWKLSKKVYKEYRNWKPELAALEVVTDWYT